MESIDFKTIQIQQEDFYSTQLGKDIEIIKSLNPENKFEIHLCFGHDFPIQLQHVVRLEAQKLCDLIKTKAIHHVHVVSSVRNQYSVLVAILPSFEIFKNMYNSSSEIQKIVLLNNFPLNASCDFVYFYTLTQFQAFGFKQSGKKINNLKNAIIGLNYHDNNNISYLRNQCFQLLLKTLGKLTSFNMLNCNYMSIASLCIYKNITIRSSSSEYGSYISIDNGQTKLSYIKDDDSLDWDIDPNQNHYLNQNQDLNQDQNILLDICLLDILGYEIALLSYNKSKYIFNQNQEIKEFIGNNFSNFSKLSFSIQPELPDGMHFNSLTGQISGHPIKITKNILYCITMRIQEMKTNIYNSKQTLIEIEIQDNNSVNEAQSISNAMFTTFILLTVVLIAFLVIFLGYKAFN